MKSKIKKRLAGVVALLCTAALLLTGTFAWQDFRQHKTNVFEAKNNPDVTLNDEYDPPKNWNTTVNSLVTKKVSVTNTVNSSSPVFVRLRFSEYLESYTVDYNTFLPTPEGDGKYLLLATWASGKDVGEYLVWDTQQQAIDGLAALNLDLTPYELDHDNNGATDTKWYARTRDEELKNGVYGKPMQNPTASQAKTRASLFGGVEKIPLNHDIQKPNEAGYLIHTWDGKSIADKESGDPASYYAPIADTEGKYNTISDYIEWELGKDIVDYEQWQSSGKASERWILHKDGWCYWATYLPVATTTSNIMENVRLLQVPNDALDYEIHIDMQAITQDELDKQTGGAYDVWPEMPTEIRTALKNTIPAMQSREKLERLVNTLKELKEEDYTPSSWLTMTLAREKAEFLLSDVQATNEQLANQYIDLDKAHKAMLEKSDKTQLEKLIAQTEKYEQKNYTVATWEVFRKALDKAKSDVQLITITQTEVNKTYNALLEAMNKLHITNDQGALTDALNAAKNYNAGDWSAGTWDEFQKAYAAAYAYKHNEKATPEAVEAAIRKLKETQLALDGDKTALLSSLAAIELAETDGKIPPKMRDEYRYARYEAEHVRDTQSTQAKVDEMKHNMDYYLQFTNVKKDDVIKMANGEAWRVLEVKDGKALVITVRIFDSRVYHSSIPFTSWKDSTIRQYLSGSEFLDANLSEVEQSMMHPTPVSTYKSWTDPTPVYTQDKIFLLNEEEVDLYFKAEISDRIGVPSGTATYWWLRTPRKGVNNAALVDPQGNFAETTVNNDKGVGPRPAMWLELA